MKRFGGLASIEKRKMGGARATFRSPRARVCSMQAFSNDLPHECLHPSLRFGGAEIPQLQERTHHHEFTKHPV